MELTAVQKRTIKPGAFLIPVKKDLTIQCEMCPSRKELFEGYVNAGLFKGEEGEVSVATKLCGETARYIILLGVGEKVEANKVAEVLSKGILQAQKLKAETVSVSLDNVASEMKDDEIVKCLTAMGQAEYCFDKYKAQQDKTPRIRLIETVLPNDNRDALVQEATNILEGLRVARDLVNEPANVLKPTQLAESAIQLGKDHGFEVEVFEKEAIEKFGMEAYLSVAKGSDSAPKLIVMRYTNGKGKPFGLVGKGLTYDTGGYSLKPTSGMETMKTDMGGAAAVIGAMVAIAKAKLPINVVGVVAACENAVSGHAIYPGDVIGSMCGKTIEVKNTDAEGRLTLIDAVYYAIQKENADRVLDIATLTGGQIVALGDMYAAIMGNDASLLNDLKKAGEISGEEVWELPYNAKVKARIKSQIADIMNMGNVGGMSSSIGGAFVGEGVGDTPWVHVDIAGPSYISHQTDTLRQGATGYGVGLLYQFIKNQK